jgi:hypothetical protein
VTDVGIIGLERIATLEVLDLATAVISPRSPAFVTAPRCVSSSWTGRA